ncbi:putative g3bp-like protein [Phtheirospermum japonicum]|uniref:Putative g3bp-like protein n=1 Tax=Phtheirospermum japonicum TaxID=374723 RepID=A0A830D876_9LAMI|nr:putative g3bp-like protein [Phtheirospermum japonicum]
MATAFPLPVTAAQVGTYFVGQYYQMLQNQPDFVHQFYSDSSTMLRIDGNTRDTATAMLQIHQLIMSLSYTGIEIKTAHSLESWNSGVLEKGFFVINDIFHYVDEEQILQHPVGYLPQSNLDSKLHSPVTVREQVPNHLLGGNIQSREFSPPAKIEDGGLVDNYNYTEEQIQRVPEAENILEDSYAVQSNGTMNAVPDHFSSPVVEPAEEPQKHTYASIAAKRQSTPAVNFQTSSNKPAPHEWQSVPETPSQPLVASSNHVERPGFDITEDTPAMEDEEVEVKSVYVRNVPSTMAAFEIGEEFKKFGKLRPDGVAIRTRKDIDVCYAFVEFEDISGVQNAIKASTVQIGAHQLYIEGRRPNRNISIRGGRIDVHYVIYGAYCLGITSKATLGFKLVTKTNAPSNMVLVFQIAPVEGEEGVEAGLATRWTEQEDALGVVASVGRAIKMDLITITTDQGGMVSIGNLFDRIGHTQPANQDRETDTIEAYHFVAILWLADTTNVFCFMLVDVLD